MSLRGIYLLISSVVSENQAMNVGEDSLNHMGPAEPQDSSYDIMEPGPGALTLKMEGDVQSIQVNKRRDGPTIPLVELARLFLI